MSRNHKFHNPETAYFVSFAVMNWLDVFTRNEFRKARDKTSNVKHNQFWRHDNKPIELWSNKVISQKFRYINNNPVEAGLVLRPEDYIYSSAIDYSGEKGLLNKVILAII